MHELNWNDGTGTQSNGPARAFSCSVNLVVVWKPIKFWHNALANFRRVFCQFMYAVAVTPFLGMRNECTSLHIRCLHMTLTNRDCKLRKRIHALPLYSRTYNPCALTACFNTEHLCVRILFGWLFCFSIRHLWWWMLILNLNRLIFAVAVSVIVAVRIIFIISCIPFIAFAYVPILFNSTPRIV